MGESEHQWPVCEGCGRRHPTTDQLYDILLNDKFTEEPPREATFSPDDMHLVMLGCENLKKKYPKLKDKIDNFYEKVVDDLSDIEPSEEQHDKFFFAEGNSKPATFDLDLRHHALITFALEQLAQSHPKYTRDAITLMKKL